MVKLQFSMKFRSCAAATVTEEKCKKQGKNLLVLAEGEISGQHIQQSAFFKGGLFIKDGFSMSLYSWKCSWLSVTGPSIITEALKNLWINKFQSVIH